MLLIDLKRQIVVLFLQLLDVTEEVNDPVLSLVPFDSDLFELLFESLQLICRLHRCIQKSSLLEDQIQR